MFKKSIIRFSIGLSVYAVLVIVYIVSIGSKDYKDYRKIVESSSPSKYLDESGVDTTRQLRENTRKSLYLNRKGECHRVIMLSENSELRLVQSFDNMVIEEEMLGVICSMQEDLYWLLPDGREAVRQSNNRLLLKGADPKESASWISMATPGLTPMQEVRYLEAESGTFNYNSNIFEADKVTIWQFYTTGHELPESLPLTNTRMRMKGIADKVTFKVAGQSLDFKAKHLQATLYSNRGL